MATAGVIVVLAYVPDIEIKSFSPLGFDFNEGGELSVWGILAVVLVYYALRSCYEYWLDYTAWKAEYRHIFTGYKAELPSKKPSYDHVIRLRWKFWILDVAPPLLMFGAAIFAAGQRIVPLVWPPLL